MFGRRPGTFKLSDRTFTLLALLPLMTSEDQDDATVVIRSVVTDALVHDGKVTLNDESVCTLGDMLLLLLDSLDAMDPPLWAVAGHSADKQSVREDERRLRRVFEKHYLGA